MNKVAAFLLFIFSASVWSAPVTWTLSDVGFADGATYTGSFDYDADTNTYSNIEIYEPSFGSEYWSAISVEHFGTTFNSGPGSLYLSGSDYFVDSFGVLFLNFTEPLTNAGGTVFLDPGLSAYLLQHIESDPWWVELVNAPLSGSVTANVVPIPAAVWLFGSALTGLGWMRRKQAA
ncbi:MAG: VPLPA-CTERM sorting domain-containing protein [bacterium]